MVQMLSLLIKGYNVILVLSLLSLTKEQIILTAPVNFTVIFFPSLNVCLLSQRKKK